MGGINFPWLAVWVLSPVANCRFATFFRRLGEAAAPGGGVCGPCPDVASYTLAFALQLRKITENLSQGSRKALGWSAPNAIRLVDLGIAGLLVPAALGFRVRRRGQPSVSVKYLPSCRTRGFPTSADFWVKVRSLVDVTHRRDINCDTYTPYWQNVATDPTLSAQIRSI